MFAISFEALTSGERPNRFERHHKDFAQKKFHTITETFLSQIDTSKKSHVGLAQKVGKCQLPEILKIHFCIHIKSDTRLHTLQGTKTNIPIVG